MKIGNIILHCSDSEWGCAREVRNWHLQRGWKDIGYHFVILNGKPTPKNYLCALDGCIECGRYLDEDLLVEPNEIGAHTLGYNANSIGVCLIGKTDFTTSQNAALMDLLINLMNVYHIQPENILGHCETASGKKEGKTCPNFDVSKIRDLLRRDQ
jgi:N-acetylmuramoyl-L-alanine amidase